MTSTSVWSPKQPWASNWLRIRWKIVPKKLPMSSVIDDKGTRWPNQLPRCIKKTTSVLEYFIKGEINEHQSKTLIYFHSFNLCKNNRYHQQMIYLFQYTIRTQLASITFTSEYNSPFQKTRCRSKHDLHSSVKTTSSRVKVQVQNAWNPQSLALHCCGFMKEWIKITGDNFQTQPICGHFIVSLKSCMETFTQIFYSYFTA